MCRGGRRRCRKPPFAVGGGVLALYGPSTLGYCAMVDCCLCVRSEMRGSEEQRFEIGRWSVKLASLHTKEPVLSIEFARYG